MPPRGAFALALDLDAELTLDLGIAAPSSRQSLYKECHFRMAFLQVSRSPGLEVSLS